MNIPIGIESVSSVSSELFWLGDKARVFACISPWTNLRNEGKIPSFFHSEFKHSSSDRANTKVSISLKNYIMIKYFDRNNSKDNTNVILHSNNLEMMRMILVPKMEQIFMNFNKVFENRKGKIYVNNKNHMYNVAINIGQQQMLTFEPSLYRTSVDEVIPCIDMFFNDTKKNSSILLENMFEFIRFIRIFDIESYALTLLNTMPRVPLGTNLKQYNGFEERSPSSPFSQKGVTNLYNKGE